MVKFNVYFTNRTKTFVAPNGAVNLKGDDVLEAAGTIEVPRATDRKICDALLELAGGWSNVDSFPYRMKGPTFPGMRYNIRNKRENQKHIHNNEVLLIEV